MEYLTNTFSCFAPIVCLKFTPGETRSKFSPLVVRWSIDKSDHYLFVLSRNLKAFLAYISIESDKL